jgi:hypothetical protein
VAPEGFECCPVPVPVRSRTRTASGECLGATRTKSFGPCLRAPSEVGKGQKVRTSAPPCFRVRSMHESGSDSPSAAASKRQVSNSGDVYSPRFVLELHHALCGRPIQQQGIPGSNWNVSGLSAKPNSSSLPSFGGNDGAKNRLSRRCANSVQAAHTFHSEFAAEFPVEGRGHPVDSWHSSGPTHPSTARTPCGTAPPSLFSAHCLNAHTLSDTRRSRQSSRPPVSVSLAARMPGV